MTDALTKNVTATSILQTTQERPACSAAPSVRLRLSARGIPSFSNVLCHDEDWNNSLRHDSQCP